MNIFKKSVDRSPDLWSSVKPIFKKYLIVIFFIKKYGVGIIGSIGTSTICTMYILKHRWVSDGTIAVKFFVATKFKYLVCALLQLYK